MLISVFQNFILHSFLMLSAVMINAVILCVVMLNTIMICGAVRSFVIHDTQHDLTHLFMLSVV